LNPNTVREEFNAEALFSLRGIKRRVNASQGFRSFDGAWRTIQGYEVLHMIRKGQERWLPKGDVLGQIQFIRETLGLKG
jgi:transposase-like protein